MVIASSVYPIRRISCSIKLQFVKNQGIQYKREIDTYVYLLPFTGKDVTRTCTFYTVLIVRKRRQIDVSLPRFACSPVEDEDGGKRHRWYYCALSPIYFLSFIFCDRSSFNSQNPVLSDTWKYVMRNANFLTDHVPLSKHSNAHSTNVDFNLGSIYYIFLILITRKTWRLSWD